MPGHPSARCAAWSCEGLEIGPDPLLDPAAARGLDEPVDVPDTRRAQVGAQRLDDDILTDDAPMTQRIADRLLAIVDRERASPRAHGLNAEVHHPRTEAEEADRRVVDLGCPRGAGNGQI